MPLSYDVKTEHIGAVEPVEKGDEENETNTTVVSKWRSASKLGTELYSLARILTSGIGRLLNGVGI